MARGHLTIKKGTIQSEPLCRKCKHSTFVQGHAESQQLIKCNSLDKYMPFEAHECTSFAQKGSMSLYDMQEIAFRLVQDPKKKGVFGFIAPKDWRKDHRYDEPERYIGNPIDD